MQHRLHNTRLQPPRMMRNNGLVDADYTSGREAHTPVLQQQFSIQNLTLQDVDEGGEHYPIRRRIGRLSSSVPLL